MIVIGGGFQGSHGWPHMEDRITPLASLVTADLPGMGTAAIGNETLRGALGVTESPPNIPPVP